MHAYRGHVEANSKSTSDGPVITEVLEQSKQLAGSSRLNILGGLSFLGFVSSKPPTSLPSSLPSYQLGRHGLGIRVLGSALRLKRCRIGGYPIGNTCNSCKMYWHSRRSSLRSAEGLWGCCGVEGSAFFGLRPRNFRIWGCTSNLQTVRQICGISQQAGRYQPLTSAIWQRSLCLRSNLEARVR